MSDVQTHDPRIVGRREKDDTPLITVVTNAATVAAFAQLYTGKKGERQMNT